MEVKPNTQALSWFYGEKKKGTLDLDPKYQRNQIWSIGQKCFLIDSIISGCPIPQVYLNIVTSTKANERKTVYEVVDGQQRLRAILEFMNDEWALVGTTAKSYPVSELYKPHIGKKYSDLPDHLQDKIWNYPLAVQELRAWTEPDIRALFRRLNYVVEKLNKQELRHSQYFGQFVETVERLARDAFWDDIGLFNRKDSQRMRDIEFVSELFIIVIDGIQNGQKSIDTYYAENDVEFPNRARYLRRFRRVLDSLKSIRNALRETRLKQRADFYALFAAVSFLTQRARATIDLSPAERKLRLLSSKLDKPDSLDGVYKEYYLTVIEGPNKITKREQRTEIILDILQ